MKYYKRRLIFTISFLSIFACFADGKIDILGDVFDEVKTPLIGANIQLLNACDSTEVASCKANRTYSDGTGVVRETCGYGITVPDIASDYILKVSYDGYKTQYIDIPSEMLKDAFMFVNLNVCMKE